MPPHEEDEETSLLESEEEQAAKEARGLSNDDTHKNNNRNSTRGNSPKELLLLSEDADTTNETSRATANDATVDHFIRQIVAAKDPQALMLPNTGTATLPSSLSMTNNLHLSYAYMTKLNLPHCQLSQLPHGFEQAFPNLSILFLSHNRFQELPAVVGKCPQLQMIAFKSNGMTSIHPEALQPQLRWCILTDNALTTLPETIGRCTRLQKFMLSGNQLTGLPITMQHCTSLELIRLAANQLTEAPHVLFGLPKLAWMGLADNPFLDSVAVATDDGDSMTPHASSGMTSLPTLSATLDDLPGDILGQGAGGVTRKITTPDGRTVALKQFHTNNRNNAPSQQITSDGRPDAERRIALHTARLSTQLPALVPVYGQTPQGSLVLEYLDNVQALANPPSLVSCSRDVYPRQEENNGTSSAVSWKVRQAEHVVATLLQTLVGLHDAGICHGDFYAHNILVHPTRQNTLGEANNHHDGDDALPRVRLTDFGAAYRYDRQADYATSVERTELRALGILVAEINRYCVVDDSNCHSSSSSMALDKLSKACHRDGATLHGVYEEWQELQSRAIVDSDVPPQGRKGWHQWVLAFFLGVVCLQGTLFWMPQGNAGGSLFVAAKEPRHRAWTKMHPISSAALSSSLPSIQILVNVGLPWTGGAALADYGTCQGWDEVRSNQHASCGAGGDTQADSTQDDYPTCGHCIANQWQQGRPWQNCARPTVSSPRSDHRPYQVALTQIDGESAQPYSWFLPQHGALEALAIPAEDDSDSHIVWVLMLRENATAWATSILHWHSVTQRLLQALEISPYPKGDNRDLNATVSLLQPVTHDQVVASLDASLSRQRHDRTVWEYRRRALERAYTRHVDHVRQTSRRYGVALVEIVLDSSSSSSGGSRQDEEEMTGWTKLAQQGWPTAQSGCWNGPSVAHHLDTHWQDFSLSL